MCFCRLHLHAAFILFLINYIIKNNAHGYNSPLCLGNPPCLGISDCNGASNNCPPPLTIIGTGGSDKDTITTVTPDSNFTHSTALPLFTNYGKTCPFTSSDATNLIQGISKTIFFYENNYHRLDHKTDCGLGLHILNGHLQEIFSNEKGSSKIRNYFQKWFKSSGEYGAKIFEIAKKHEEIPEILDGVNIIGNHNEVWISPKGNQSWKSHDIISNHETFTNIGQEKDYHNAYLNFQCLVSLVENCEFPSLCQKTQTAGVASQYKLTHQILFLQFAEQRSCLNFGRKESKSNDWEELRAELCAKVYQEAAFFAQYNYPIHYRHLFTQQVAYCGSAGYPNFFRSDWLQEILSWQSKGSQGCVTDFYGDLPTTDKVARIPSGINGEPFTESCLVRMTSMALAALALNLRYMVHSCSHDIFEEVFEL